MIDNQRRGELIDQKIDRTITEDEREELSELQARIESLLDCKTPLPMGELHRAEELIRNFQAVDGNSKGTP